MGENLQQTPPLPRARKQPSCTPPIRMATVVASLATRQRVESAHGDGDRIGHHMAFLSGQSAHPAREPHPKGSP
jgi:hypothetical protein